MNKLYKVIAFSFIFMILSITLSNAHEITNQDYFDKVKSYIKEDKIEIIKEAPIINIKAITKGMNLGYLDPKVKEIKSNKDNISNLIEELNEIKITNDVLEDMNEELLIRLNTMHTYLECAEKQYSSLIGYDRHYLGKYFTLKFGEEILTTSADNNLKDYNEDYKEVKRIYRDIKQSIKDM